MKFSGLVIILCNACLCSFSQPTPSQEKLYALSLITFAKGTSWPGSSGKCVIGVWDYAPLFSELAELAKTRNVNGKPIQVIQISDVRDALNVHVLFLPSYKHKIFPQVLGKTDQLPVLVVTNKKDVARTGGCIDIMLINGKLNYEINATAIEKRGMKVTMALKNMGILIESRNQ